MKPQTIAHTWLKLDADNHTDAVVALAVAADGRTVVSAAECTLRVWDVATQRQRRQILGNTNPRDEGGDFSFTIGAMALTPDGHVAVTVKSCRRVEVFDVDTGNLLAAFEHAADVRSLAFSPDGRWLALGVTRRHGVAHERAAVQVIATRALMRAGFDHPPVPAAECHVAQTRRVDEVMHLAPTLRWIPAPLADLPWPQHADGAQAGTARGHGLVVAVHSLSDATAQRLHWLAWRPGRGLAIVHTARPDRAIEPATLAVSATAVVIATKFDGHVGDAQRPLGRLIALNHRARLLAETFVEQAPAAAAFARDGQRLVVGLQGDAGPGGLHLALTHVMALDAGGFARLSTYYGHDLPVQAVAWLNADTVLSAGGDNNAIHLWNPRTRLGLPLHAFRGVGQDLLDAIVDDAGQLRFNTVPQRMRPPNHAARQLRFDLNALGLFTVGPDEPDPGPDENGRWDLVGVGRQILQLYHRPDAEHWEPQLYHRPDTEPSAPRLWRPGHLTLFVGTNDEWVLWTRSGFYATNAPEKTRIGYCVDRGPHREALFLPADRFPVFDRADIVRAVVEHGSEERARANGVDIPHVDVAALLPPVVEIERASVTTDRREVNLGFEVEPPWAGQPTTRLWILRNGRFVWVEDDPEALRRRRWRLRLRLNPGRNVFSIHAECPTARSVPCVLAVEGPAFGDAEVRLEAGTGKLFVLSVGVSNFEIAGTEKAGTTERLRFPHRDATAVFNVLAGSRHSATADPAMPLRNAAFESVAGALLVDEQATKKAILGQVQRFADEMVERERAAGAERDVLLVFLSGHGVRFAGEPELYFWNWDLINSEDDMERTGLSLVEFAEIATAVPAEVVLIIDACHSGMAGNNLMRGLDPDELARRIRAVHERGLYVINASRSEQRSFEHGELRHGLLTHALLEALRDRRHASGPDHGVGMLGLVDAIQTIVPRLGARLGIEEPQTPVCRMYGDLLPLTIYAPPRTRRASPRLRAAEPSDNVRTPNGTTPRGRKARMATKTAPAKKTAAAKKAAAKKAPVKKAAAKKAPAKKAAAKKATPAKKAVPSKKATPPKKATPAKKATPPKKAAGAKKAVPTKSAAAKTRAGGGAKPGADVVRRLKTTPTAT
jgi:uncharacterized caspase-like protein